MNGMSFNNPGNSSLRKNMCHLLKLLSKTNGLINFISSKPHYTFTENLLWKLGTLVWCWFPWDDICKFCELLIPSLVKDFSSMNKTVLNSWRRGFVQLHKSTRWQGLLVQDAEPYECDKGINILHVQFTTLIWEANLQVESFGLLWTISGMVFCMFMSGTAYLSDCTQTLGRQLVSCDVWWSHENTPLYGIVWLENAFCILLQQHVHCHHEIHTQNACHNIRCGKTQKPLLQHLIINCNSDKWLSVMSQQQFAWPGCRLQDGHVQCMDIAWC